MKKIFKIVLLLIMTKILFACAKPEVVSVIMPGDESLNCVELTDNYEETRRFKKEAENVKEINTGGNMVMLQKKTSESGRRSFMGRGLGRKYRLCIQISQSLHQFAWTDIIMTRLW